MMNDLASMLHLYGARAVLLSVADAIAAERRAAMRAEAAKKKKK